MVKTRLDPPAFKSRRITQPLVEPGSMHAVAGAIDVAAKQAFVRLHQLRRLRCDGPANRASEAPVAPQTADVKRVAQHRLDKLEPGVGPLPRIERNGDAALEQRFQCALDKTLAAAMGRVALANNGEAQASAPYCRGAGGANQFRQPRANAFDGECGEALGNLATAAAVDAARPARMIRRGDYSMRHRPRTPLEFS